MSSVAGTPSSSRPVSPLHIGKICDSNRPPVAHSTVYRGELVREPYLRHHSKCGANEQYWVTYDFRGVVSRHGPFGQDPHTRPFLLPFCRDRSQSFEDEVELRLRINSYVSLLYIVEDVRFEDTRKEKRPDTCLRRTVHPRVVYDRMSARNDGHLSCGRADSSESSSRVSTHRKCRKTPSLPDYSCLKYGEGEVLLPVFINTVSVLRGTLRSPS